MSKFYFFIFLFLIISTTKKVVAQSEEIQNLELQVYNLNNQFKYTESQSLVKNFIQENDSSNEDLTYAYVIWSYIYKRLYDYPTTLSKLERAKIYAEKSNNKEKLIDVVNTEFAFALFDTGKYDEATNIMQGIKNKNFKHNTIENKAKLLMQIAYIAYLNKQYHKSEATYQQAIALLKKSIPCDLPIIYTKMMNLYHETNQLDKLQESLNKSLYYADSCNILKYSIYTYEEYDKILKKNNNIEESFRINKIINNLKEKYDNTANLGQLHVKEHIDMLKENDEKRKKVSILSVLSFIFIFIILFVLLALFLSRKNKKKLEHKADFYTEKYNTLWSNHQLSIQQLEKLKEELLKQEETEATNLAKKISVHLNTNTNNDHQYINMLKDDFINALQEKAPYLTSKELLVCFFINLKLPHKEIAELLNRSKKSIDSYKYRINTKIKKQQGLSIDELINSVVKNTK